MEQAVVQNWDIGPNRFPTTAQNPYLKFSAFAYPAAFTVGTLGRNTFESPGMSWTQMSISKSWSIWERVRIITRLDMMNLPLKPPQFTGHEKCRSPGLEGDASCGRQAAAGA